MDIFDYRKGNSPLLISMPHAGSYIPEHIQKYMTKNGRASIDTDWYVEHLYDFAKGMGVYWLQANYSRYVIDLNRGSDDKSLYPGRNTTGLCPVSTFAENPIYLDNKTPDENEITLRLESYWYPYHRQLESAIKEIKAQYGYVIVLEAHTIASVVPRFFSGQLPDFNFGTNSGQTCPEQLLNAIRAIDFKPYSVVFDDVFKGGYITRNYPRPSENVYTLQLELSQAVYMDEGDCRLIKSNVNKCQQYLKNILQALLEN